MRGNKKFKRGAASFYIVALSTLVLVIIATSFATVILSETSRSENDELSQSAYDSALAGVEDAKIAFSNYRRCVEAGKKASTSKPAGTGTDVTCEDIIWWMQNPDCYMVGHILGKIPKDETTEVAIGGTTITGSGGATTTNQAYTCVTIDTDLSDYRATLTSENMSQVIRAGVADGGTNSVSRIKISWYSVRADNHNFLQYSNFRDGRVTFGALSSLPVAVPPTLEVQIVQTAESFTLSQFDVVESGRTNRGTVYLVPTSTASTSGFSANSIAAWNGSKNYVSAGQVVKTNDHTVSNKPFVVYCNPNSGDEFYCSAEIELPGVIGGAARANDTFMIGVTLPYQKPNTDFAIELICEDGGTCGGNKVDVNTGDNVIQIKNTQVSIDSTGRANDLYRRVETRLETSDTAFGYGSPYYVLQILGNGGATKNITVTNELPKEYGGFYF